ncbi:restriction endonuclease subunit S [Vibrio owensii]|uniref:restriction endonuclease subunit S n=1 Tax=Vibrio owensii TaxID=696485 RepID=UPI002F402E67
MSQLSYMDKLLDGVEVEWKELGNSITFQRGKRLVKSQLKESGEYAVFQNSMTPLGYYHESNVSAKSAFVICAGAAGEIGFSDDSFWAADDVYYAEQSEFLNSKYLYHFLLTQKHKIASQVRRASIPRLSKSAIEKLIVPIPCPDNPEKSLAIQAEIVRILDAFTAMTAELTAELNLRQKQYNYYRDQLLSFEEGEVEWKALGKIAEINTGQKPSEILDTEAEFDYINAGTTRSGYCALSNCEGDTVTTPSRGQGGIGFVGYQNKSFWLGPLCYKIRSIDNKELINKYLFYILQSKNQLLLGLKKEGGVPAVNKSDLAKLEVPVPSVAEQERIVEILDKFDTLTTSIQEGLPREIELRQKQYEYYRDLLLSFPRSNEGAA